MLTLLPEAKDAKEMNALEGAKRLRIEAEKLLFHGRIEEIRQAHSNVSYTGSYSLDLMASPDIDIAISILDDPFDKNVFLEIGGQIGHLQNTISMKFRDFHGFPVDPLPDGLYWGIGMASDSCGPQWNIDLWALPPAEILRQNEEMAAIKRRLDANSRILILEIKNSLLDQDGNTPTFSGYYIYQAVLFRRLQKRNEIIEYDYRVS